MLAYKTGNGKDAKVADAFNYMLSSKAQNKAPSRASFPEGRHPGQGQGAVNKIGQDDDLKSRPSVIHQQEGLRALFMALPNDSPFSLLDKS